MDLSLILGGAESNLWDLCKSYAFMAGTLDFYTKNQDQYRTNELANLNYEFHKKVDFGSPTKQKKYSATRFHLAYIKCYERSKPTKR
jgi:penicillin-binding protein 1C